MSDESNWITSKELLRLWFADRSNMSNLEHKVRPALRAGLVSAKAMLAELEARSNYGGKTQGERTEWNVPKDVWKGTSENSHFDLRSDTYSSRAPGIGYSSVKLSGISFDREQVLKFANIAAADQVGFPTPPPQQINAPNPRGAGRPVDKAAWTKFAAAFAVIARDGEVDLAEPGVSANKIYGKIDEMVRAFTGEDALGIDSVRDVITLAQEWARRSSG